MRVTGTSLIQNGSICNGTRKLLFFGVFLLQLARVSAFSSPVASRAHPQFYEIQFPLTHEYQADLVPFFDAMVETSDFLVKSPWCQPGECRIPLFGDSVRITFGPQQSQDHDLNIHPTAYTLQMMGDGVDDTNNSDPPLQESDFGWICAKFLECKKDFPGLDTKPLAQRVASHYNSQPPHPGYDAALGVAAAEGSATENQQQMQGLLNDQVLSELQREGFVVVDSNQIQTSEQASEKLGDFVLGKSTGQDAEARTDAVAFLDRAEAELCDIGNQFDFLMSIASHLNDNLNLNDPTSSTSTEECYNPIAPGTHDKPLSNPSRIQAAEYGMNDFYTAHSDNSWADVNVRNNYRYYTCILYCNEGWTPADGGALRLYRDSTQLLVPSHAKTLCPHVDVNPHNGRLLIFDSKLVHSVEKVTQDLKSRRALTLWILKPEDSGVRGEVYYADD